jgi:hypothetical protein
MTIIDKIEKSLGSATAIQFFPTPNYEKEPPVIVLTFDKPHDGAVGYNLLLDNYKDKNASLVIFKNANGKVDISIVAKDTADAINIKNLKFDSNQLADFLTKEPKDRRFVFAIGFVSGGQLALTATREPFSPVLLDKYEIK